MPRPGFKRHRSGSKSPKERVVKKDSSSPAVRLQQLERRLAHKAVGERPIDSDDSDKLVTRSTNRPRRNGTMREVYASGAVAKGDKPGAYPTRAQRLQHLARDTKQVIKENMQRRSSSATKSASPASAKSPLNVVQTNDKPDREANNSTGRSATRSPPNASVAIQQTPGAETSILGTLKPRRRQASILHMIENNDESTINPEDEEQFLPDDESTPLRTNKPVTPSSTKDLASSSTRKRKLRSGEPAQPVNSVSKAREEVSRSSLVPDSRPQSSESSLPLQSETEQPRRKRSRPSGQTVQDEDDIMAPPQSSSPEPSPERSIEPITTKAEKSKPSAPTTKDLQSLMPSKRRQGTRERTKVNEFDIPEDTSSDVAGDDSTFNPRKRLARKKEPTPRPKSSSSATGKSSTRAKSKPSSNQNTSTTPATPRPSTIRTPLPLTRSVNAENRKLRSPLIQTTKEKQTPKQTSKSKSLDQTPSAKKGKQSGGSSLQSTKPVQSTRTTRRTRRTEAIEDQENQDSTARNQVSSTRGGTTPNENEVVQTIEQDENDSNVEIDLETDGQSPDDDDDVLRTPVGRGMDKGKLKQGSQWANKWADIDNWSLEYEEVSISTRSSSPGKR